MNMQQVPNVLQWLTYTPPRSADRRDRRDGRRSAWVTGVSVSGCTPSPLLFPLISPFPPHPPPSRQDSCDPDSGRDGDRSNRVIGDWNEWPAEWPEWPERWEHQGTNNNSKTWKNPDETSFQTSGRSLAFKFTEETSEFPRTRLREQESSDRATWPTDPRCRQRHLMCDTPTGLTSRTRTGDPQGLWLMTNGLCDLSLNT